MEEIEFRLQKNMDNTLNGDHVERKLFSRDTIAIRVIRDSGVKFVRDKNTIEDLSLESKTMKIKNRVIKMKKTNIILIH